ncbi:MAG: hypothetical protein ACLU8Y_00425 [Clostridia bacterium]
MGYVNLDFKFTGISEELIFEKEEFIQEITITYKCEYNENIIDKSFKSKESDWINFKWVDIHDLDNYDIHPRNIKDMIKKDINHLVEIVNK